MATDLFELLAANPNTPAGLLRQLARQVMYPAATNSALARLLASNPGLPADLLDEMANVFTYAAVRQRLLRNPAATAEQARAWVRAWAPQRQVIVMRKALAHVPDPDGSMAELVMDLCPKRWLFSEVLTSQLTIEPVKVRAAFKMGTIRGTLKGTERDRVVSVLRRHPTLAPVLAQGATDEVLRQRLLDLGKKPASAAGNVPPAAVSALTAWMLHVGDEQQILDVLRGDDRTAVWRAAATACRAGWDELADAVLTWVLTSRAAAVRSRRSVATALVANPTISVDVRARTLIWVCSTKGKVPYHTMRAGIFAIAATGLVDELVAASVNDDVSFFVRAANLPLSQSSVRLLAERELRREARTPSSLVRLLSHPNVPVDMADALAAETLRLLCLTFSTVSLPAMLQWPAVKDLPWQDLEQYYAPQPGSALLGPRRRGRPSALPAAAQDLHSGWFTQLSLFTVMQCHLGPLVARARAAHATRLGDLAQVPAGFLGSVWRSPDAVDLASYLALLTARDALAQGGTGTGSEDGEQLADALALQVLNAVASNFEGTLGELVVTLRASLDMSTLPAD